MAEGPKIRVLIVDDQRDLARAIRMAVAGLGEDFEALDVPSAEEALLEAQQKRIDVLIADVRLPGLRGDVMVQRIRALWPEVKVLLVTGLPRDEAQELANRLEADALFHKPFEMADLLDAVERQVGAVESVLGTPSSPFSETAQVKQRLSSLLVDTRRTLGLRSLMLVGESGYALVRAGECPEGIDEPRLITRLLAVLSAGGKVLRLWQETLRHCLHVFPIPWGMLLVVAIEARFALVAWDEQGEDQERTVRVGTALWSLASQVEEVLRQWALLPPHPALPPALESTSAPEPEAGEATVNEPPSEDLLALLDPQEVALAPEEAEAFWDSLTAEDPGGAAASADVLSFEEAKRLGLVPFTGEDESES